MRRYCFLQLFDEHECFLQAAEKVVKRHRFQSVGVTVILFLTGFHPPLQREICCFEFAAFALRVLAEGIANPALAGRRPSPRCAARRNRAVCANHKTETTRPTRRAQIQAPFGIYHLALRLAASRRFVSTFQALPKRGARCRSCQHKRHACWRCWLSHL